MVPIEIEKMELDVYARAVYQRIQYRAGGHSSHFESQENMAKALFISSRQVIRKIKELEEKNMIHVEKRGRTKGGHFLTNVITLLEPSEWFYPHHVTDSHTAMCTTVTPPCDSQSHITRSHDQLDLTFNYNAAAGEKSETKAKPSFKQSAATKQKEATLIKRPPSRAPKTKMKTWDKKSEDEKMDAILHRAIDAHRLAVDRKKAKHYPFDDTPDLLLPIIEKYGVETIKEFFDYLKQENLGCDIRRIEWAIDNFVRNDKYTRKKDV